MNIDDIIENAQLKGRIIALDAQVETLTAEVRCLEAVIRSHERVDCLTVANLKAEVERLEKQEEYLQNTLNQYALDDMRLQAEVERLRKAGDGMYSWLGVCGRGGNSFGDDWLRAKKGAMLQAEQFDLNMKNRGWNGWNAAKEGKQS